MTSIGDSHFTLFKQTLGLDDETVSAWTEEELIAILAGSELPPGLTSTALIYNTNVKSKWRQLKASLSTPLQDTPLLGPATRSCLETRGLKINGRFSNFKHLLFGTNDNNEPVVVKKVLEPEATVFNLVFGHDSIVQGEVVKQDHRTFIIMPVYAGSIAYYLALKPPMSQEVLFHQGKRIKAGLEHTHSNGYAHSDVKPANIFFSPKGDWYLGDFGSAVPIGSKVETSTTEFLPDGCNMIASPRLDFYMLGVTLISCLDWQEGGYTIQLRPHSAWINKAINRVKNQDLCTFLSQLIYSN